MNVNYLSLKAKKIGMLLIKQGIVKGPKPIITKNEITNLSYKYDCYKVGGRSLNNIFILMNNSFATVYVRAKYTCYRKAYQSIIKTKINNKDVDHLYPRSKVKKMNLLL